MKCKKCGARIHDNKKICENCGEMIGADGDADGWTEKRPRPGMTNFEVAVFTIVITVVVIIIGVLAAALILTTRNGKSQSPTSSSVSRRPTGVNEAAPSAELSTPPDEIRLNTDLVSDIGRTYGELREKYGEGSDIAGFEWELYVDFEGNHYSFRAGEPYGSAYGWEGDGPIPEDDAVCYEIATDAKTLFYGLTGTHTPSDLELLGISPVIVFSRVFEYAGEMEGAYCHGAYGDCEIDIALNEEDNTFTGDSTVWLELISPYDLHS